MSTDIPKTQTLESIALENAMSGKVHDIPTPDPVWVQVDIKGGKSFIFDLNDAPVAMFVLKILKENKHVTIRHRKEWQ